MGWKVTISRCCFPIFFIPLHQSDAYELKNITEEMDAPNGNVVRDYGIFALCFYTRFETGSCFVVAFHGRHPSFVHVFNSLCNLL